jgi:DNA-binding NarL/FixJ family response regulator
MEQLQVNHKDGNKRNNNLENLEWVTNYENTQHAIKIGLRNNNGERNPSAKLIEKDIYEIVDLIKEGKSCAFIAKQFNVSASSIERIKGRKTWTSVTNNLEF